MKAIQYKAYSKDVELDLAQLPKPQPGPNELLIQIHASSVNPIDWKLAKGDMRLIYPLKLPAIPGFDLSGTVEEVGSQVQGFAPGDEVFSRSNKKAGEASAEYICLEASCVAKKPARFSFQEAAALPLAGLTALQGMRDKGALQSTQHVLINGASGGVGIYAVQIAKALGARVTAVCSTANLDFVQELGADETIDYKKQNPLGPATSYDLIFDAVASLSFGTAKARLKPKGRYITTVPRPALFWSMATNNPWFSKKAGFILMQPSAKDLTTLSKMVEEGKLKSIIDRVFPLEELSKAWKYSQTGRAKGKIVIEISKS